MLNCPTLTIALAALLCTLSGPAAAQGEILLTHQKALAGNVTPGDPPGYPIVLTLPGSYKFSGNVHPSANTIGIQIGSPNVTIDLNGFQLHGSTTALYGIAGAAAGVTIRNGTVTGFDYDGIYGTGVYWIIENMRVVGNGEDGIEVAASSQILRSTVAANGDGGIVCGVGCHVEGNVVQENGGYGVSINRGTVLGNTIVGNDSYGIISTTGAGFGNNTVALNNENMTQVFFVAPLEPNYCVPACP